MEESNSSVPPTNQAPNSVTPKQKGNLLVIAGCIVLLTVGIIAGYFISKKPSAIPPKTPAPSNQPAVSEPLPTSTVDASVPEQNPSETPVIGDNSPEVPQIGQVSGIIKWNVSEKIAGQNLLQNTDLTYDLEKESSYYKVGEFVDTKYKGGELILLDAPCQGPCPNVTYRFVKVDGEFALLEKYSEKLYDGDGLNRAKFTVNSSFTISDLEYPDTITGPLHGQILELVAGTNGFFDRTNLKPVFKDNKLGTVYTDSDSGNPNFRALNGFYVRVPDGTLETYTLKVNFVGKDNVPKVTWSDGAKNTQEYVYTDVGGCGSRNYAAVVSPQDVNLANDLKLAGTNSDGDPIYEFKDPNNAMLKGQYENEYNPYNETKISYQEFVQNHPMFFWVDPFDRLIKFENNKFILQAECAKPVIYLYPEKPTQVSVKVSPVGGLLKADPPYGENGWVVKAEPNGTLIELLSAKVYPYLFWEGRGGIYNQPTKGFVVAGPDVHNFLVAKLAALGLNSKESADFLEFWGPRMKGSPYYFVSFLTTREVDKLAPLEIIPPPDTLIRILMDFTPLEKPIPSSPYDIATVVRRGFTVVEWGGVLR